jgi:ribonucleoside-diphosphate reductase alpha chain
VLDQYLRRKDGLLNDAVAARPLTEAEPERSRPAESSGAPGKIGDLCPECGEAAVVNEEGCRKCYACGYSEC